MQGFSVQGRIESTRRNYTAMWEQIHGYSVSAGKQALKNFRLNILGESVEMFTVPGGWHWGRLRGDTWQARPALHHMPCHICQTIFPVFTHSRMQTVF